MNILFTILILISVFTCLIYDSRKTDEARRRRYKDIKDQLIPGYRYPIWRLEEMLRDKNKRNKK